MSETGTPNCPVKDLKTENMNLIDSIMTENKDIEENKVAETQDSIIKLETKEIKEPTTLNLDFTEVDLKSILYYNSNLQDFKVESDDNLKPYLIYLNEKIESIMNNKNKKRSTKVYKIAGVGFFSILSLTSIIYLCSKPVITN